MNHIRNSYIRTGHSTAFSAPGNVKRYFKNRYKNSEILETLQGIDSYTLHREYHKPRVTNPFYVTRKRQQIQMDLIDISRLKDQNDGITFLLIAIDTFTKYAWVRTLKRKTAELVLAEIKSIMNSSTMGPRKPESIFFDRGTEFINRNVTNYLNSEGIEIVHPSSEKKAAVAERFNKTFQILIYKYLTENSTRTYRADLGNLMGAYNHRGHRTLKYMSPADAEEDANQNRVLAAHNEHYAAIENKRKKPKYKVGERVLVKNLPTSRFHRSYQRSFRHEQFEIVQVNTRMPIPMYILKSLNKGDVVKGGFYAEELQPVKGDVFKINVLKRRKYRGKQQLFVSWVGYDDTHNCWIDADSVTQTYN